MRIEGDGTPYGTRVYDDSGEQILGVVALQRVGKNLFVTHRHKVADVELDGPFEQDFHLTVTSRYQPIVVTG